MKGSTGMTLLDHSSIITLLAGLRVHHGVFRFLYEVGGTTRPWKLVEAFTFRACVRSPAPADAVQLRVNFQHDDAQDGYHFWLGSDGWLVTVAHRVEWRKTGFSRMRVVREAIVVDDTLRRADRRRDRGFADIFGTA